MFAFCEFESFGMVFRDKKKFKHSIKPITSAAFMYLCWNIHGKNSSLPRSLDHQASTNILAQAQTNFVPPRIYIWKLIREVLGGVLVAIDHTGLASRIIPAWK